MNDEWSRCPICFEDYSVNHRPTTFECGHSTCIDHVMSLQPLQFCPICRHRLRANYAYHVSFNLQEASQLFQLIKDKIDWSTIQPPPAAEVQDPAQISAADALRRDEVYARRLQAELNRQPVTRQPPVVRERAAPVAASQPPPNSTASNNTQQNLAAPQGPHRNVKSCGHGCDLRATARCCACSDQRPNAPGQRYPVYADGRRTLSTNRRDEWYCPTCKRH